jgi:hypothetical protein
MWSPDKPISLRGVLAAIVLVIVGISDISGCHSRTAVSPNNGKQHPSGHSVKLSWNPSLPATKSSRDAIVGYMVYRSAKPHDLNAKPINPTRVAGTTYVDLDVESGKVYYYVTRAVSASGAVSGPSNEIRVEIPR